MLSKKQGSPGAGNAETSSKNQPDLDSGNGKPSKALVFEITEFTKIGGALTKCISLTADGKILSDGSACKMSRGTARRVGLADGNQLGDLIDRLAVNQAIALGTLREGLPDQVKIVTKKKLRNGAVQPGIIARVGTDIVYRKGQSAFALLDYDSKGMPPEIAAKFAEVGGFWPALISLLPTLEGTARVERRSTSAGLSRSDTGKQLRGSDGIHIYLAVQDGGDVERFLKTLHDRAWMAGFGWYMVGVAGQLLERSIVDRSVGGAERLVFEGPPVLKKPLKQDRESRRPRAIDGEVLDTTTICPPLTDVEAAAVKERKAKAAAQLKPEIAKARAAFIEQQAERIVARKPGMTIEAARHVAERHASGVLLPDVVLPFDDKEFDGCTVADVLAEPDRFVGATLADPLEGMSYGVCAKILRRPDGTLFINSYAHGGARYDLKFDYAAVRSAVERADNDKVVEVFVRMVVIADLNAEEIERLRNEVSKRSGISKRTVDARRKEVMQQRAAERTSSSSEDHYEAIDGALYLVHKTKDGGTQRTQLSNFVAEIQEVVNRDDGSGIVEKMFRLRSDNRFADVPAAMFDSMNWVTTEWGPYKRVMPGHEIKMLLAHAIKTRSTAAPVRTIYIHLGWRKIDDRWVYLHAGGAIGANGAVEGYEVDPSGELRHYVLPTPHDLRAAVRASLSMRDLGPTGLLMLAVVYRAPLAHFHEVLVSIFLTGVTGSFKSAIEGVAMAHYGRHWNGVSFPANWSATANALEKIAFLAKDALLVIDDFKPSGTTIDVAKLHQKAEQVLRGASNKGGRGRMNADGSLRPTYWPRGQIMCSGEDVPKGHSLNARLVIRHVDRKDTDTAVLSRLQDAALQGLMSEAMTGYVQWLAARADTLADELNKRSLTLRQEIAAGDHARTPDNVATLVVGMEYFAKFAVDIGAVDTTEAEALCKAARKSFLAQVAVQDETQSEEDMVKQFLPMLGEVLASGRAHIADRDTGDAPNGRELACGWHADRLGGWQSRGDKVGWINKNTIFLTPRTAYAAVESYCREQNRTLGFGPNALSKRLMGVGLLLREPRYAFKVKGTRVQRGLCVRDVDVLCDPKPQKTIADLLRQH